MIIKINIFPELKDISHFFFLFKHCISNTKHNTMNTLKLKSKNAAVFTLCEMLSKLGYPMRISDSFTAEADAAVKDFQKKNALVIDGICMAP